MSHSSLVRSIRRCVGAGMVALSALSCRQFPESAPSNDLIKEGKQIFRDDTFGNEVF